jgi:putative Mn2+ efflux pump MntP
VRLAEGVILGMALAVDAAVVSFAIGLLHPDRSARPAVRLGLWFGAFQGGMAWLGFTLAHLVGAMEKWGSQVAGVVFLAIGGKLLWDVFIAQGEGERSIPQTHHAHAMLAFATSIDALAAGVGLVSFPVPYVHMGLIAALTFVFSAGAVLLSSRVRHFPEAWLEATGAAALIFLGVKNLL